jgi:outer membrane lipoprotein-sorting protein
VKTCILAAFLAMATILPATAAEEPKYAPDKDRDTALKAIETKAKDVQSFATHLTITSEAGLQKAVTESKLSFRLPDKTHMITALPIGNIKQTVISDGQTLWTLVPAMNLIARIDVPRLRAELKKLGLPDQTAQHNIAAPLALIEPGTARLQRATQKINGQECWVFEGKTASGAAPQGIAKKPRAVRIAVSTADGLARRIECLDHSGRAFFTVDYQSVQVNPELDPELFSYEPPKDAAVADYTEKTIHILKTLLRQKARSAGDPTEPED